MITSYSFTKSVWLLSLILIINQHQVNGDQIHNNNDPILDNNKNHDNNNNNNVTSESHQHQKSLGCYRFPSLLLERDLDSTKIKTKTIKGDKEGEGISLIQSKSPPTWLRGLTEVGLPDPYKSKEMTIGICQNLCMKLNFSYSSLMNGDQCRCGNDNLPESMLTEDNQCQTPCQGKSQENCGGSNDEFTTIYSTTTDGNNLTKPLLVPNQLQEDHLKMAELGCISTKLVIGLGVGSGLLGLVLGLLGVWLGYWIRKFHRQRSGRVVHGEWEYQNKKKLGNKYQLNHHQTNEKLIPPSLSPHSDRSSITTSSPSPPSYPRQPLYQLANLPIHPTLDRTSCFRTSLLSSSIDSNYNISRPNSDHHHQQQQQPPPPRPISNSSSQFTDSINFTDHEPVTLLPPPSLRVVNPDTRHHSHLTTSSLTSSSSSSPTIQRIVTRSPPSHYSITTTPTIQRITTRSPPSNSTSRRTSSSSSSSRPISRRSSRAPPPLPTSTSTTTTTTSTDRKATQIKKALTRLNSRTRS